MNTEARLCPRLGITLACILVLSASCNMPGLGQNRNLGSQSQALSGGGNQGAGAGAQSTRSPGYGSNRLQYDHHFTFDHTGADSKLHMEITVKGMVPITDAQNGLGPWKCVDETIEGEYLQVSGTGTIPIQGSADSTSGRLSCSCSFTNSLQVNILGKTHYEWLTPGDKCQVNVISLQMKEKWYTAPAWQCTCTTPEQAVEIEQSMDSLSNLSNPELEKKTLTFQAGCAGDSVLEADLIPLGVGSGTYRWTYTSSVNEPSDQGQVVQQPGMAATEWQGGTPVVRINSCVSGWWGPPLESIAQPVDQWFPVSP